MQRFFTIVMCLFGSIQGYALNITDTLIVAYRPSPPFVIAEEDHLEGVSVWLWERCAKELHLPYKLVEMEFGEMLDSVATGGVDVSINPLTITSRRLKKMDFTHSFYASHSVIVKGEMSALRKVYDTAKSIFSINFWSGFLILMTLILLFGVLMWFFENSENNDKFRKGIPGIGDGVWWAVVTMTTVGYGDKTPSSRGGKIVALVWMFSGLLFISGLTASVASSLTVDKLASDSTEFLDFKDRTVGTIQHSSSAQYLRDHYFRSIKLYNEIEKGLNGVLENKVEAFIYDEPIVRYQIYNHERFKNLAILHKKFGVQFYGFALPKHNTELTSEISQKIIDICERNDWQDILHLYGCGDHHH